MGHDRFVHELIRLTEIPAPPFKECARAEAYLKVLAAQGLSNVETDAEGNVMGIRKGSGTGPMLAILAHLDSFFRRARMSGSNVTVRAFPHPATCLSS